MKHCDRLLVVTIVVFLGISFLMPGKAAPVLLAGGVCWFFGAAPAAIKGTHAVVSRKATIIPGWSEFSDQAPMVVERSQAPVQFWLYVALCLVVVAAALAYGIYAWPGI